MADVKFSEFASGGDIVNGDIIVGLRSGVNTKFNSPADPTGPFLLKANNLSDVANTTTAFENIGLGRPGILLLTDADFAGAGGTYVLTNPPPTIISMSATSPGRVLQLPPQNQSTSIESSQQIELLVGSGSDSIGINNGAGTLIFLVAGDSAWRAIPNDRTTVAGAWEFFGEVQTINGNLTGNMQITSTNSSIKITDNPASIDLAGVVSSWNGSTTPVDVTAGSGVDITGGVISLTGTGASASYGGASIQNLSTVISFTDLTTWKPLVGTILASDGVDFTVNNNTPSDPTTPFYLEYTGTETSFFEVTASFSMRRFSSTTANGYYISISTDGINPISGTFGEYQTDYGINGTGTSNSKTVCYTTQLQLSTNGKIYFLVQNGGPNTTTTDTDFLSTNVSISVKKIGDIGGLSSGVASLNGLTGVLSLANSDSTLSITPSGSNINLAIPRLEGTYITNGITYFNGTSITSSSALTNGQILIGSTGSAPVAANITPGTGISIANSTGIIIISANGNGPYTELTTSGVIFSNHQYTANSASLITMTLPGTSAIGDYIKVNYKGTGGWKIAQSAGQQIQYGNVLTTLGIGGSLASSDVGDCVQLVCITANTLWEVQYSQGNLTVV